MRAHIDGLVEAEMRDVVEVLFKAQQAAPREREEAFVEAQRLVRKKVIQLARGPHGLERRLKNADLAARIHRLVERQSMVLAVTRALVEQPPARRDAALAAALRDQREVQAGFERLIASLSAARSWGGGVAQGAAEGLEVLKSAGVEQALETSLGSLEAAQLDEAAESQQAVVRGLELLLEKVEAAQGLVEADREVTLERVREFAARQEKLRAETAEGELTDDSADALVKRQTGIHQGLAELVIPLRHTPPAGALLDQARRAAFAASDRLFELAAAETLAEQDKVSAHLAQIEERLVEAAQLDKVDKSAAAQTQLADLLSRVLAVLAPIYERLAEPRDATPSGRSTTGSRVQPAGRHRDLSREPWFAKLPPEVRRAVRAQARQPAPRGYEERLRRYFESLD